MNFFPLFFLILNFFLFFSFTVDRKTIHLSDQEATPLEKDFFKDIADGSLDTFNFIEGYFVVTGVVNKKEFDLLNKAYRKKKKLIFSYISSSSSKKKAEKLCELMHQKKLLKQYSFDAVFVKPLIKQGLFNCVTSSAVYRDLMITAKINSKFAFVDKHIYKYVYLNNVPIQVEPTNPYGFDPGKHNMIVRSNGSRSWTPKVRYQNPKIVGDFKFLASLYLDARVWSKIAGNNLDKNIAFCKKGLILDLENDFLQQNFIYWTSKKANKLYALKQFNHLESFAISSIQVLSGNKYQSYQKEMLRFIAYALLDELRKEDYQSSSDMINRLKKKLSREYFQKVFLISVQKANRIFLSKNEIDKSKILIKFSEQWLSKNKQFEEQKNIVSRVGAKSSKKIEELINYYLKEKKRNHFNEGLFSKDIYDLSYHLGVFGRLKDLKKNYSLLEEHFPTKLLNEIYKVLIVNLIYQSYDLKEYDKGIALYHFSKKLFQESQIDENYIALIDKYVSELFFKDSLNAAILFLVSEEKKSKEVFAKQNYFASKLSEIAEKEIKRNNNFSIFLFLKNLKNSLSEADFNIFIKKAIINGTYVLIEEGYYDKAMQLVEETIEIGFDKELIKNNYLSAVNRRVESILLQKDEKKAMSVLSKALQIYSNSSKLRELVIYHLGTCLESLLIEGDFKKVNYLISKIKSLLDQKSFDDFLKKLYVSASYQLIQKKAYHQSLDICVEGLSKIKHQGDEILNNYRYALNEYLSELKKKNLQKAKSALKQAVRILGENDKVIVFWNRRLRGF